MEDTSHTILPLIERYFRDGVGRRELTVLADVLHPDYIFHTGGETLIGRDEHYIPAVKRYLQQQPDIAVTLHDVICTDRYAAVHLTKTTAKPAAAWRTILLYRGVPDRHLTECWYEQDWASCRSQVRGLEPVPPLARPLRRPWHIAPAESSRSSAEVALRWIEGRHEDCRLDVAAAFGMESLSIDCLFSAGPRFAFHLTGRRTLSPGIEGNGSVIDSSVKIVVAGLGTVVDDKIVDVCTVSDQRAVRRQVRAEANP